MLIENRPLTAIRPYPNNPRLNEAAVSAVAESIRHFGWRQPIVVDGEGVIVCGHTRFLAAQHLGMDQVPVHVATDLSPDQVRAYRIADNKSAELAEWNLDQLALELKDIEASPLDIDLEKFGFAPDELAKLLGKGAAGGDEAEAPMPPEQPVTRLGDLWLLGEHRVFCGDSSDATAIERLMGDDEADLLLTDPPYNVGYVGATAEQLTIANDAMDESAYERFLVGTLGTALARLRAGGAFYIWHADSHGHAVRSACTTIGLTIRQCLMWVKSALVLGRQDYHWRHEPCLYGWKDGAAHTWLSDRSQTTVLTFDKPARNGEHPTMKPIELFAYLMGNSCERGGVVLDPFGGSGTTVIAAEQTGRRARVMEIDPRYADVIVRRWVKATGGEAVRIDAKDERATWADLQDTVVVIDEQTSAESAEVAAGTDAS